jgi:hypothetical protein
MGMALNESRWLVRTMHEYEALARRYVFAFAEPARHRRLRQELQAARQSLDRKLLAAPLFDTELWVGDWQRGLLLLWDLCRIRSGSKTPHLQRHLVVSVS